MNPCHLWQVRGAYIVIENERAAAHGYPSPICDAIDHTHASYNRCSWPPPAALPMLQRLSIPAMLCVVSLMANLHMHCKLAQWLPGDRLNSWSAANRLGTRLVLKLRARSGVKAQPSLHQTALLRTVQKHTTVPHVMMGNQGARRPLTLCLALGLACPTLASTLHAIAKVCGRGAGTSRCGRGHGGHGRFTQPGARVGGAGVA